MQNRIGRTIVASCVALFLPCIVRACTIVYPTVEVGREYRVRVTDRGRPVGGLRVLLGSGGGQIQAISDVNGYARFDGLFPGSLVVSTQYDGDMADAVEVHVSSTGPADATVELTWPSRTPLSVRSVRGILRGPDYYPTRAQGQLSISLVEGASARVIETTQSDSKGQFSFSAEVPSGIYYLRLNPSGIRGWDGEQIQGTIPIEVSSAGNQDALDLDLGWTSCGLSYAQRVSEPDLKVHKICGDVTDTEGGVVDKAQVLLLADKDVAEVLEQTKSGRMGEFAIEERNEGSYQLIVKSPGFRPSLRVLHVEPAASPQGCPQPIHIRLGVM
jgi:hypothetical protein